MKNFVKEGQKLPLFGIGPYLISGMEIVTAAFIVLFYYVLKIGTVEDVPKLAFIAAGCVLIVLGILIWYIGALRSGMDESIAENRLRTGGIYALVRNPMYSGVWFLGTGISLLWHNYFVLIAFFINWAIMTIVLKNTEEKWLTDLYGEEYEAYKERVNRCIPWKK